MKANWTLEPTATAGRRALEPTATAGRMAVELVNQAAPSRRTGGEPHPSLQTCVKFLYLTPPP